VDPNVARTVPGYRHQRAVDRIRKTIVTVDNRCSCTHVANLCIRFPDGRHVRPDISIFCREPFEDDEDDRVLTRLPEAVVEVVDEDSPAHDLEVAPSYYLSHGVKDVIVFDPRTRIVLHVRATGTERWVSRVSPKDCLLECGCRLTV
jgi:Uma2 family endonuclease